MPHNTNFAEVVAVANNNKVSHKEVLPYKFVTRAKSKEKVRRLYQVTLQSKERLRITINLVEQQASSSNSMK